jgi:hypothetical protein
VAFGGKEFLNTLYSIGPAEAAQRIQDGLAGLVGLRWFLLTLCVLYSNKETISAMASMPRKRLMTVRIVSCVFVFFLMSINILSGLFVTNDIPSLGSIVHTIRHWWLLDPAHPDYVEQFGNFNIHVHWHPMKRSERFPSVEERVKLYMSNWYHAPCEDASTGKFAGKYQRGTIQPNINESWPILIISDPWVSASGRNMMIDSYIMPDRNILLHRATIEDCARNPTEYNRQGKLITETRIKGRSNLHSYCSEVVELMNITDQLDREDGSATPILAFFGDSHGLCGQGSF